MLLVYTLILQWADRYLQVYSTIFNKLRNVLSKFYNRSGLGGIIIYVLNSKSISYTNINVVEKDTMAVASYFNYLLFEGKEIWFMLIISCLLFSKAFSIWLAILVWHWFCVFLLSNHRFLFMVCSVFMFRYMLPLSIYILFCHLSKMYIL